jgi:hypothetical protein
MVKTPDMKANKRSPASARHHDRKIVTSLEDFAQKKGHVRALEEFRMRQEKKHLETAMRLRQYKKVMKQEGMEAGRGSSRKRRSETRDVTEIIDIQQHQHKRHKTNPLQKSVQKAQENKQQAKLQQEQRQLNEKERAKKLKQRQKTTKLLQQRTKRGQPIMKHMVDSLLQKLEKQPNQK